MSRVAWVVFAMAATYLTYIFALVAFKVAGPYAEQTLILRPVQSIAPAGFMCDDGALIFRFRLNKTSYPGNGQAELTALNVRAANGDALVWRSGTEEDNSSFSAPAGEQVRSMVITGACGREFYIITRHISPITGLVLVNKWGPYADSTASD